ncbi:hypothetical protein ABFA07_017955 [Porites harrisoni]
MSYVEANEPDHSNSLEIVDAGKQNTGTDITLIYNPTTGGFRVQGGIINSMKTYATLTVESNNRSHSFSNTEQVFRVRGGAITDVDTITEVKAVSNEGHTYTITRGRDGGYTAKSRRTWLSLRP